MKKFAIILSGCGVYDGSEIHETVLTMLALNKMSCEYVLFAPDMEQSHVVNHLNGKTTQESRNVLVEAARIARGQIQNIDMLNVSDFDAVIFPGGFGVAKNLSTYAFDGIKTKVLPKVEQILKEAYQQKKPIGALCIAPVLIAAVIKDITVTIGNDEKTIKDIQQLGAHHVGTSSTEVIIDKNHRIFTTPCYMLAKTIKEVAEGTENLIRTILDNLN